MHTHLHAFFVNCYSLFSQVQGFHWNVEGENFFQLHTFFEEVYTTLFEAIDELAERLRALGEKVQPDPFEISLHQTLDVRSDVSVDASKMVEIFLKNTHKLVEEGKELCTLYEQMNDLVTQDRLLGLLFKLEKFMWMARSYLKVE